MSEIYITLAVEDELSATISRKILSQSNLQFVVSNCLNKGGNGYLRSKINSFNKAAKGVPFYVLTDQDTHNNCPPSIIRDWFNHDPHSNLIFRVAVMEVEAWIMADREAFARYLNIPVNKIPHEVDSIADPKQFLVNLARRSRNTNIRKDLAPQSGSTATVGPDYNSKLSSFIIEEWDINVARNHSPSLNRTFARINEYEFIREPM